MLYNSPQVPSAAAKQASSNDNTELIDLSSDDENMKKKDGNLDKIANAKLQINSLQSRIGNKGTTLTLVKPGMENKV